MIDYFGEREELKKERVHKNELQRLRNIKRQTRRTDENMLDASIPLGVSKDLKDRTRHEVGDVSHCFNYHLKFCLYQLFTLFFFS